MPLPRLLAPLLIGATAAALRLSPARLLSRTAARTLVVACEQFRPPPLKADELAVGQIVVGAVVGPAPSKGFLVDIGLPTPAYLHALEVALSPNTTRGRIPGQGFAELEAGEAYEALVIGVKGDAVNVSLAQAQRRIAWRRVMQLVEEDATYRSTVLRIGGPGVTVDIENLPAFVPWSHWHLTDEEKRDSWRLIGTELPVKFLEVDMRRGRMVASNRRVQVQNRIEQLAPGEVVEGVVVAVKPFGAVVRLSDMDNLDGLLHISQMSRLFVDKVEDVLAVGDRVRAVVLKVDAADGSINLSTKMLEVQAGDFVKNREQLMGQPSAEPDSSELESVAEA